jgi:hypothetical protein
MFVSHWDMALMVTAAGTINGRNLIYQPNLKNTVKYRPDESFSSGLEEPPAALLGKNYLNSVSEDGQLGPDTCTYRSVQNTSYFSLPRSVIRNGDIFITPSR